MSLRALGAILAFVLGLSQAAYAQDERTFATIVLNSENRGETVVLLRLPDILMRTADLGAFGVRTVGATLRTEGGEQYVSLRSLAPKLTYAFDQNHVTLTIYTDPSLLSSQSIDLAPSAPAGIRYGTDPNAFLNYNLSVGSGERVSAFFEGGVNTKTLLGDTTLSLTGGKLRRGLSFIERDDRRNLRKIVAGDTETNAGELQGSAFIAGISVQRSFEFDPYLVRMPLPTFHASVATPSTADVYVNGVLVRRVPIEPGSFDLQNIPVTNGPSDTSIVMHDAFGRTVNYNAASYESAGLLRKGLIDYGVALGALRTGLFTPLDAYRGGVAMGRYTRGLSDSTTAGAQFQARPGGLNGGVLFNTVARAGYIHLAYAASRFDSQNGAASSFQYVVTKKNASFGVSAATASSRYATATLRPQDDRTVFDLSAFLALPMGPRNGISFSAGRSGDRDGGARARMQIQTSIALGARVSLSVSAARSISATSRSTDVFANLTVPLGERVTASSALDIPATGGPQAQFLLQRSNDSGPGIGYALTVSRGSRNAVQSFVRYQSAYGDAELVSGGAFGQPFGVHASISGGLASMGAGIYASRPLQDGFAVIDAGGASNLAVYLNNQYVGRTDRRGALLVPALLPYYGNAVSVSTKDTPLNLFVRDGDQLIAPRYHGGMVVHFETATLRTLVGAVTIHGVSGEFWPEYGELRLINASHEYRSDLTQEGGFYYENLTPGSYRAIVAYKHGVCTFALEVPQTKAIRTDLGRLTCIKR